MMKLIANKLNNSYLENLLQDQIVGEIDEIKIAVAYAGGDPSILQFARKHNIKLTYYCRYDHTVPVSLNILRTFLDKGSPNYRCYMVDQWLHAKVIWLVNYGLYIGSANLTQRAWWNNIEAGMFYSQSQMDQFGLTFQFEEFFEGVHEHAVPLKEEDYLSLEKYQERWKDLRSKDTEMKKDFEKRRTIDEIASPITFVKKKALDKKKSNFIKEWNETLQLLRDISKQVSLPENMPGWIDQKVPTGILVDQFLHAYYYNQTSDPDNKNRYRWREFYEQNSNNPQKALDGVLKWWASQHKAPSEEDTMLFQNAPKLERLLTNESLSRLTEEEFVQICQMLHAFKAVARQVTKESLGIPESDTTPHSERIILLAKKVYHSISPGGRPIQERIQHLLYGSGDIVDRLFEVVYEEKWRIPHFGLSCLGEIIGWALPDKYPPRNGRTSKALYALGNDVTVHSV